VSTHKRIGLFIDNANLRESLEALGWRISFRKTLSYIEQNFGTIKFAKCYMQDRSPESMGRQTFMSIIKKLGVEIYLKKPKKLSVNGVTILRCDVDSIIAPDMVHLMHEFDEIILVSGDSDFIHTIEILQSEGKKVTVISTNANKIVSKDLINACDQYIDLKDIADAISIRSK
jgi:uncharacterized LabA/DUF88 family protein